MVPSYAQLGMILMVAVGVHDADSHLYRKPPGFSRWPADVLHRHNRNFDGAFRPFCIPARFDGVGLGDIFQEWLGVDLKKAFDPPGDWASVPKHRLVETNDAIILYVDLPGCKKQHVDAVIAEDAGVKTLKITAVREEPRMPGSTPADVNHVQSEKTSADVQEVPTGVQNKGSTQRFELSFTVGDRIDTTGVRGTLEDGILTLVLPRLQPEPPAQPIDIPIDPPAPRTRPTESGASTSRTKTVGEGQQPDTATRDTHISLT